MKRVSVVILNWNGVDMLRKFIPSVIDNSVGEGIEICVADNASSDGSLEMLRTEFPVVRLIELIGKLWLLLKDITGLWRKLMQNM